MSGHPSRVALFCTTLALAALSACSKDDGLGTVGGNQPTQDSAGGQDTVTAVDPGPPAPETHATGLAPVLYRLLPSQGPTEGGSVIVVEGAGFYPTARVRFGTAEATVVTVYDPGHIVVKTPASVAGVMDVTVENPDGGKTTFAGGFTYWLKQPNAATEGPRLVQVTPNSGPAVGGTAAALIGTTFTEGAVVLFNWRLVPQARVISATQAAFVTLPAPAGSVDVVLTNPDGQSSILTNAFAATGGQELEPPPHIGAVSPASGPVGGGTAVTITGDGLRPGSIALLDGALVTDWKVISGTEARFTTPKHAPGVAPLWVSNADGQSAFANKAFLFFDAPPTVYHVTPDLGPSAGGTVVTISGARFAQGATVSLGGKPCAALTVVDAAQLTCTTPAGTTNTSVDLLLTNPDGLVAQLPAAFRYEDPIAPPPLTLTGAIPMQGPAEGGILVYLQGTGFTDALEVRFGDTVATPVWVPGAVGLVATLPPGAPGQVKVGVRAKQTLGPWVELPSPFTYVAKPTVQKLLDLESVQPPSGPTAGGGLVLLRGAAFPPDLAVWFGPTKAATVHVLSTTLATVRVPAGKAGVVDVTVADTTGASAALKSGYLYATPDPAQAPKLTKLVPPSGPAAGGTLALLQGSGLVQGGLAFLDATPLEHVTLVGPSAASLRSTPHAAGTVDVTWVNPDGQWAALSGAFTYVSGALGTVTVSGITPLQGSTLGGTAISVTGSGFTPGSLLFLGGIPHDVTGNGSTALTSATQPHAAGAVDVAVTSPSGVTAVLASGYTYALEPPIVHETLPSHGAAAGGNTVTVLGSGFANGAGVAFGALPCLGVVVTSPAELSCQAPAGTPGASVAVTVSNPSGLVGTLPSAYTYDVPAGAPVVLTVSPTSGPTTGELLVLITGQSFQPGASVTFGAVASPDVHVPSSDAIVAALPPAPEGTVSVTVKNPDGKASTLPSAFTYVVASTGGGPAQSASLAVVTPPAGPVAGGGHVILRGYGFVEGMQASFGKTVSPKVVLVDPGTAIATVPAAAGPGAVDVSLVLPSGATAKLASAYAYVAGVGSAPALTAIKPPIGPTIGGTLALVTGQNLDSGALVFIDGVPATAVRRSSSALGTFKTPANDAGPADVEWVNPDGFWAKLEGAFIYTTGGKASTTVTAVVPVQGSVAGGTVLSVSGTGFAPGSLLFLDGEPIDAKVLSSKTLTATTPPHAAGLVDLSVTPPDGWTATLPGAFNFVVEQPFLAAVTPSLGLVAGGTTVTLVGQGFHPSAQVTWAGGTVAATWLDGGHLTLSVPAHDVGTVAVTVTNPDGLSDTLEGAYTYVLSLPGSEIGLTGVAPAFVPTSGGTWVAVTGKSFGVDTVALFGNAVATSATLVDAGTLLVAAPAQASPGPVDLSVVATSGATAKLPKAVVYYDAASLGPWPVVSSMFPVLGPTEGGTVAAIAVAPARADAAVWVGDTQATVLGTDGTDTLVVKMPPASAVGTRSVTVVFPEGKAGAVSGGFTYYVKKPTQVAPTLASIAPTGGKTSGGQAVALKGQAFANAARGFIGYRPLVEPKWTSALQLDGKAPTGTVGLADVAVTNPDGLTAVLPAGFAFSAPKPNVNLVFPSVGSVKGGLSVVVSGEDLHAQATLTFGGKAGTNVVVFSPQLMTATLPATATAGPVDVTVTNPGPLAGTLAGGFTYTDKTFTAPAPDVMALVPAQGPYAGGTVLALYGASFQPGAQVLFGGKPATVHRVEGGFAVVTSPSGFIGAVDVTLLNPDGQADTLPAGFSYLTPAAKTPKLFGITPSAGPEAGGTPSILTGDAFTGGGLGFVGYRPLSSWTVLNGAIATGTIDTLEPGAHDVVETNGDGQSATLKGGFSSVGAPVIDGIEPAYGPTSGGTLVTLAGKNFATGLKLTFGGVPAQAVQVLSPFVVKCQTPPGTAGPAQVKIVNPDAQLTVAASPFVYLAPPEITGTFPKRGPATGGTPVIISGNGLLTTSQVLFGSKPATKLSWLSQGGTQTGSSAGDTVKALVATAPPGTIGAKVDLTVTNPDGQSAIAYAAFEYVDPATLGPAPTLGALLPPTGPTTGGTWGLASGTNLAPGSQLVLGTALAETHVLAATQLRFVSGATSAAGPVDVWIVQPDGQSALLPDGFTYTLLSTLGPAPAIAEVDPERGPTKGGTHVTVSGNGLTAQALVFFGTTPAPAVALQGAALDATTPPHGPGTVTVTVTANDGQTVHAPDAYTFVPPPVLTGIAPVAGPAAGGTYVTLTGQDFAKTPVIYFCDDWSQNDACAPCDAVVFTSKTTVSCTTPAHTAGDTQVVLKNPDGQVSILESGFLFRPPPTITALVPPTGSTLGATKVTVYGKDFQPGATVTIGGTAALDVTVLDSETLTLTTPPGTAGPAVVVLKNPDGGLKTLAGGFVYVPPPIVTNVFPNLGPEPGGTVITIQGTGFVPGAASAVSKVQIGQNLVDAAKVNVISSLLIQAETPPGVGPAAVKVINPDGQTGVLAGAFTYVPLVPAPEVKTVTPPYGPTSGGYIVKLTGNHFLDGAEVAFGKGDTWSVSYDVSVKNNGTLIVCTAPAHPAGKVDVRVTNTDGQSHALTLAFEYTEPQGLPGLAFAGIEPKRGPTKGGYFTTVFGQGFKQGMKVYVGSSKTSTWTEALDVIRLGPTLLRVKMPQMPKGPVDVRLSNPALGGVADEVIGAVAFTYGQGVVMTPKGHLLPIDVTQNDRQPVIFDANGDALPDVMIMHHNQKPDLFINTRDAQGNAGVFVDQTATNIQSDIPTNCWEMNFARPIDIDKDGDLDVLYWSGYCYYDLKVWRNNGNGIFKVESVSTSYYGVQDVTVADFNCDGLVDVFLSRWSDQLKVLLINDGTGYFREPSYSMPFNYDSILPAHKEPTRAAAAADVDHDGDMDLVIANDQATQDRLYYNNCNNITLPPQCVYNVPNCTMTDRDGHRYAFCSEGKSWYDADTHCKRYGMRLATVNDADEGAFLKASMGDHSWLGGSDAAKEGTWAWLYDVTAPAVPFCANEPNGSTSEQCTLWHKQNGCAIDSYCYSGYRFICEAPTTTACTVNWQFSDAAYGPNKNFPNTGFDTWDVEVVDIDQDGWEDVFMTNRGQSNRIYRNIGGNFVADDGTRFPQTEDNMAAFRTEVTDVDQDGDKDLIIQKDIGSGNSWVDVYFNDRAQGGQGAFVAGSLTNIPTRRTEDSLYFGVGDLNADALPDIYVVNGNSQDWLWLNHGFKEDVAIIDQNRVPIGAFANNTILGTPEDAWTTYSAAVGDIDGDQDLDIVLGNAGGQRPRLWVNDGAGNFFDQTGTRLPDVKYGLRGLELVDLNGDGDLDLVGVATPEANQPGGVRLFANNGQGFFVERTTPNVLNNPTGTGWRGLCVGDVDQDGDSDFVIVGSYYTQDAAYLVTNGQDAFNTDMSTLFISPIMPYQNGNYSTVTSCTLTDMNGDGWPDLYLGIDGQQNRLYFNDTHAVFV